MARDRSPGGAGDGLPAMPDGEPLLARWFVVVMVPLVLVGLGVTVWAFSEFGGREDLTAAQRRPPGTATVTHERGTAVLNEVIDPEDAVGCGEGITLHGDDSARATVRRALSTACQLLETGDFPAAEAGLETWRASDGILRVATFEFTGTESSARVESDRIVVELSPRFQFDNATRGAPFILHELVHMAQGWPGTAVDVAGEIAATEETALACDRLALGTDPPLGCIDAADLLADDDLEAAFVAAGYTQR